MPRHKPVVIELTKATGTRVKGEVLELANVAAARKHYPDHKVLHYADGTPYEPADDDDQGRSPAADASQARQAAPKPPRED